MLGHRLLGVFLHLVIDGRVDAEAVLVQVVRGSVPLHVLVQPAEERVFGPEEGVRPVIVVGRILLPLRLFRGHRPAEHVPEIGADARRPVHLAGMQFDGKGLEGIPFRLRQVAGLAHLADDEIAAGQGLVGIEDGIVPGRLVDHPHQHGALLGLQFDGLLGEELVGRGLDAVGVGAEEHGVQVHVHDLLLGIVPLDLHGGDPLFQLDPDHLDLARLLPAGIEGLGQLLGDGAAAALAGAVHQERLEQDAPEALEVDARVLVETDVLRRHGRLDQVRRQFVVIDEGAVFDVIGRQDLAFLGDDLGGQLAVRVLQFLDGRDLGERPYEGEQHGHQHERGRDEPPEYPDDFLLFIFGHSHFSIV